MSFCGHSGAWWVLVVWIVLVGLFVVCAIGYFCGAARWCDRRAAGQTRRRP
jgi:hypothetical protein